MRTAVSGGWSPSPEVQLDRHAAASRWADVVLRRMLDHALVEVIDLFTDVGAAGRDWQSRLEALERHAIARMTGDDLPSVSGVWLVRATRRNRQLVNDHRLFFRALMPGSGAAWLAALTRPDAPMPRQPALLWVTVNGDRIYPARLG